MEPGDLTHNVVIIDSKGALQTSKLLKEQILSHHKNNNNNYYYVR